MKKFAFVCLLLISLRARGDLVLVEQIDELRQQHTVTVKIKGDKYRKDMPGNITAISDLSTGEVIWINHGTKNYRKITMKQAEEMAAIDQQKYGAASAKPPKIVDTGKSEQMDGHNAEIYTAATMAATFTFWVAKDYPDYAAVSQELKKARALMEVLDKELAPDALDGIVIKSESLSVGGSVTRVTLVSAKTDPIDDSEFRIPDGYTEIHPPPPHSEPPTPPQ